MRTPHNGGEPESSHGTLTAPGERSEHTAQYPRGSDPTILLDVFCRRNASRPESPAAHFCRRIPSEYPKAHRHAGRGGEFRTLKACYSPRYVTMSPKDPAVETGCQSPRFAAKTAFRKCFQRQTYEKNFHRQKKLRKKFVFGDFFCDSRGFQSGCRRISGNFRGVFSG